MRESVPQCRCEEPPAQKVQKQTQPGGGEGGWGTDRPGTQGLVLEFSWIARGLLHLSV